jgi:hypothetical protein
MPTKRRKLTARPIGLSAAALEAWRIGDRRALNRALQVRPWQASPFETVGKAPSWPGWEVLTESWPRAVELRAALIAAAGPPGRVGRHGEPLGQAVQ